MLNKLELRVCGDSRDGWHYELWIDGSKRMEEGGFRSYRAAKEASERFAEHFFSMAADAHQVTVRQRRTS